MKIPKNNKGQVTFSSLPLLVILVGVAIVFAMVVSILIQDLQSQERSTASTTITNETNGSALTSSTAMRLGQDAITTARQGYSLINDTTFLAINSTTGCGAGSGCERVANRNFTFYTNGTIILNPDSRYNLTPMNFTYTFQFTDLDAVENVTRGFLVSMDNLSDNFGLIGTIVGLALLITTVLAVFAFRRSTGGSFRGGMGSPPSQGI